MQIMLLKNIMLLYLGRGDEHKNWEIGNLVKQMFRGKCDAFEMCLQGVCKRVCSKKIEREPMREVDFMIAAKWEVKK